jgi:hypothetical protein
VLWRGRGKKSVASDQPESPDGEAQPLKERGVFGPVKRISTISLFSFFLLLKGGNEGSNSVISFVVIEMPGELHFLDARVPILPMLSC